MSHFTTPKHALLRPKIVIPFLLISVIWGSTWFVILGQLDGVPAVWSVAYRFILAAAAMFILAATLKRGFRMTAGGHIMAFLIGVTQFFLNYNFVYESEFYLTSGIVAVLYGMLMVPNAILARIFLGERIGWRFVVGTVIALGGIFMLLMHEGLAAIESLEDRVGLGVVLALLGVLCASIASVLQATKTARHRPIFILLAWAMAWGAVFDVTFAWAASGPPVFPSDPAYWAGVVFLAIFGSVITFPLYFGLIRDMGAGRAAYTGVLVPVVAMGISTIFEGYQWSGLTMGGAGLAVLGMVVALRGRALPRSSAGR